MRWWLELRRLSRRKSRSTCAASSATSPGANLHCVPVPSWPPGYYQKVVKHWPQCPQCGRHIKVIQNHFADTRTIPGAVVQQIRGA